MATMRKDPHDEYAQALDIGLAAADQAVRAAARNDAVLEGARLGARRREARRLAHKYEDKAVDARAQAAVRDHEARVEAAREAVDRSYVERVEVAGDRATVHGIVRAGKPADLEVVALTEAGETIGRAKTDARGYWRLDAAVPVAGEPQQEPVPVRRAKLPMARAAAGAEAGAGAAAAAASATTSTTAAGAATMGGTSEPLPSVRIQLVVRRDDRELYRDKVPFTVRAGRVQYRELLLEEG